MVDSNLARKYDLVSSALFGSERNRFVSTAETPMLMNNSDVFLHSGRWVFLGEFARNDREGRGAAVSKQAPQIPITQH